MWVRASHTIWNSWRSHGTWSNGTFSLHETFKQHYATVLFHRLIVSLRWQNSSIINNGICRVSKRTQLLSKYIYRKEIISTLESPHWRSHRPLEHKEFYKHSIYTTLLLLYIISITTLQLYIEPRPISCYITSLPWQDPEEALLDTVLTKVTLYMGAPIKNNPLEKMLYFSHGSTDLRLCMWVFTLIIDTVFQMQQFKL